MNKAQAQRVHAKKRAKQRYDLDLNRHEIHELVQRIQCGNAKHVESQSNRTSIFRIEVNGKSTVVVYDKSRHNIVSFLPSDYRPPIMKPKYIIVKNAGMAWEYHFEDDPKLGVHESHSAHFTYSGRCADLLNEYDDLQQAEIDCKNINESNPSGDYAVCLKINK